MTNPQEQTPFLSDIEIAFKRRWFRIIRKAQS